LNDFDRDRFIASADFPRCPPMDYLVGRQVWVDRKPASVDAGSLEVHLGTGSTATQLLLAGVGDADGTAFGYDSVVHALQSFDGRTVVAARRDWRRADSPCALVRCSVQHERGLGHPGHEAVEMHNSLPGQFAVEFLNLPRLGKKGLEGTFGEFRLNLNRLIE
jgi:hypothetical protein